jgi:hypothetical protein
MPMENSLPVMSRALRKLNAAIGGIGHRAVAIGAVAQQARGSKRAVPGVEVLVSSNSKQRDFLLSAARGEGLQQSPDHPLHLRYPDANLGATADVTVIEASTPFHNQVIARAEHGDILSVQMPIATPEDLILLGADRAVLVELLRMNAARIDGAYLKREAEAAGLFEEVKLAWQEARKQP